MVVASPVKPWASFCLATFRRSDFLRETLGSLKRQTWPDFEIIVSDNDPAGSGQSIVKEANDSRIGYYRNDENVGMVKNFNRALSRARGEFVVMVSDDDPVYPDLLKTLRDLSLSHPDYGAYYAACEIRAVSSSVAQLYGMPVGHHPSLAAHCPPGGIRLFSAQEFPRTYYSNQVFPYVLWSTGMVRRQVALDVGGMPDFGSPFFTDFGYIALAGAHSGCATINTVLGCQTVHDANFGRSGYADLHQAIEGYHNYMAARLSRRSDWIQVQPLFERFLAAWVVNHTVFLHKYFKSRGLGSHAMDRDALKLFDFAYTRAYRWRYLIRTYFPIVFNAYRWGRQRLGLTPR